MASTAVVTKTTSAPVKTKRSPSPKIEVGASGGARLTLRTIALGYLLLLLAMPLGLIRFGGQVDYAV